MVKRRLKDAGLSVRLSPHSFRVTTITDLLEQGVPRRTIGLFALPGRPGDRGIYREGGADQAVPCSAHG